MAQRLWRAGVIVHRYLGIAVGVLMAGWFASGIVMMYVGFPQLSARERLAALPVIDWKACCALDPIPFPADQPIRAVRIETAAGTLAMLAIPEGQFPVMANLGGAGGPLRIDERGARASAQAAAARLIGPGAALVSVAQIARDQWTVAEDYGFHRPLYRFAFGGDAGTTIYISGTTGEAVLWTTRNERFWNWLGAIPHWLYFTRLRRNAVLWTRVMVWTSIAGGFLTLMGLALGITQLCKGRGGTLSPYRGWNRWHHLAGLVFGVFALTWVISGTLSMNPWGLLLAQPGPERARATGKPPVWSAVKASIAALKANPPKGAVAVTAVPLAGQLYWIAEGADGSSLRLDAAGNPAPMSRADVEAEVARIAGARPIASAGPMADEDAYYYALGSERTDLKLPVYRVILADADSTRVYIDPDSGRLLKRVDSGARGYRWWFEGLHRLDFTAALRTRPLRDALLLILLAGGLAITGTGVYLALRRVRRDLAFKPAPRR
jgi:hypothetical protein